MVISLYFGLESNLFPKDELGYCAKVLGQLLRENSKRPSCSAVKVHELQYDIPACNSGAYILEATYNSLIDFKAWSIGRNLCLVL